MYNSNLNPKINKLEIMQLKFKIQHRVSRYNFKI